MWIATRHPRLVDIIAERSFGQKRHAGRARSVRLAAAQGYAAFPGRAPAVGIGHIHGVAKMVPDVARLDAGFQRLGGRFVIKCRDDLLPNQRRAEHWAEDLVHQFAKFRALHLRKAARTGGPMRWSGARAALADPIRNARTFVRGELGI